MNRRAKTFEMVAKSKVVLALGTTAYLEELRNDQSDLAQQVNMAKALKKGVILIVDSGLSPEQKDELRTFFRDFDTVKEVMLDQSHNDWGKLEAVLKEMGLGLKQEL